MLTWLFAALPIVVAYEDADFRPLVAGRPDGPAIAVLSGDPDRGPSTMLMRLPRMTGRMHTHSADYHLVVLEGRMKHWSAGESEATARELGPGGYWFQPGGRPHADSCLSQRCVMFITWAGPRDAMAAD